MLLLYHSSGSARAKAEADWKQFKDVVEGVSHDFYCCSLFDLSLLHLRCTGDWLRRRTSRLVQRGVSYLVRPKNPACTR